MSELKGTNVASLIVPFADTDTYATHDAKYGRGGFRAVNSIAERDSIPSDRRSPGMLVYVINDPSGLHTYQLGSGGGWERSSLEQPVEVVDSWSALNTRTDLHTDGRICYIKDSSELLYYSTKLGSWLSTNNVKVQDTAPEAKDVVWFSTGERSLPEYENEDLVPIVEALQELQKVIQRHEFAFKNVLGSGDFTNNLRNEIINSEDPLKPDAAEDPTTPGVIPSAPGEEEDPYGPEYPEEADEFMPNLKHFSIKMGSFANMTANRDYFVDGELLWCKNTKQLYIKSGGELVWLNKNDTGGSGGGGSLDYDALDKLDTIGFVEYGGTQIWRVKVAPGGLISVYKKELDTPQTEPTGGNIEEGTGWVYVNTLYLQKLYINSIYCGGLTADEHSYNYCSHNFVELSNLTTSDINLNGLSLQYSAEGTAWEVLPLWGTIKAGSTFLIRGAQCSVMKANTTKIKVETYDMEWRNSEGNLIKFDNTKAKFYLCWGNIPSTVANPYKTVTKGGATEYRVSKGYIDLVGLNITGAASSDVIDGYESKPYAYLNSDRLFTKYYNMDPVSQATKALTARNNNNDWYFVDLTKNSGEVIPNIECYTPKASSEGKDLFFNKTKLRTDKPNLVFIGFGIRACEDVTGGKKASRCFNWVSVDYYDEFLWYRRSGQDVWTRVESFKSETGVRKYYNRIRKETTSGIPFVAHKVVLHEVLSAGDYEFCVGRPGSDGGPGEYVSEIKTFTVRTTTECESFTFVQVSDQQGFNWDEYQVWKKAAGYIKDNVSGMHFTLNTGDMTQNGNRVNEWLDYKQARDIALSGYEEMATIGNNDLCPANVFDQGNGGDASKLNAVNMSFFYTFEINEDNPPVFTIEGKELYIDSLYSFDYGKTHFLCVNSEIPEATEISVYGLSKGTQVYDKIKTWVETDIANSSDSTWRIAYCHEMPFTIMTQNLICSYYYDGVEDKSIQRGGSRMNTNTTANNKYWFSRFAQEHDIRLVIGGHKHTQTSSWPIKENYTSDGSGNVTVNSMKPIIQVTSSDLSTYFDGSTGLYTETSGDLAGFSYPTSWQGKTDDATIQMKHLCTFELVDKITAPVYVMSQATGYKHTSNKELPAPNIPWLRNYFPATVKISSKTKITATVNAGQKYPFYTIWTITPTRITGRVLKINYIFDTAGKYNVNLQSRASDPVSVGGNGEKNNGEDLIIIEK